MRVDQALRSCAVVVLVGALLTACGDSGGADEDPGGRNTSGLTAPGTTLDVGKAATVPLSDATGVVKLTVTAIDKGDPGDLKSLTGTPYYVHLKATAVSGDGYQFFAEQYVTAWAGDERVGPIASPVTVGSCTRAYFKLAPPVGTSIEPCLTFVVDPGSPAVDRIGFYVDDDYQIEDDTDIEWR